MQFFAHPPSKASSINLSWILIKDGELMTATERLLKGSTHAATATTVPYTKTLPP